MTIADQGPGQKQARTRRQIYEDQLRKRSLVIAGASTIAVVLAVVILVPMAPGWAAVKKSFFNWEVFQKTFPKLLDAFLIDVMIFVWCAPAIAILGLLIALARDVRNPALFPLRIFGAAFTDVFRGVPVVLTVYLIGFGIPGLGLPRPWNSPYIWGSLALIRPTRLMSPRYFALGSKASIRRNGPQLRALV